MTICPFAVWRPVGNHGGGMSAHLGLVLHVQQGNGGLSGWFNNPASGASSTWWVAKSGTLEQYVDADVTAWAQGSGNSTYNSVETEGWTTEALTPQQESMLARLYKWGNDTYGWRNALAEAPGQPGFGWHGMGGAAWGGHTGCPGDLRKNRRAAILAAAFTGTTPAPGPAPADEEDKMYVVFQWRNGLYLSDMIGIVWVRDINQTRNIIETVTRKPLQTWPVQPDTPLQFGRPVDADTANKLGVPFP